ncbi:hypothetical protein GQ54DRAFT_299710 [Martensiomyces pterosporus]|nr:hypothetical protein GQ54DRAFT_299710 [Martensiomyces pterosporus]
MNRREKRPSRWRKMWEKCDSPQPFPLMSAHSHHIGPQIAELRSWQTFPTIQSFFRYPVYCGYRTAVTAATIPPGVSYAPVP